MDYHAVNSLLLPVVKTQSTTQGILSLVPFPKTDELYAMLNGSTDYSSLDCTAGSHHIALSPKTQKLLWLTLVIWIQETIFWFITDPYTFSTADKWHTQRPSLCYWISRWHLHIQWEYWNVYQTFKSCGSWVKNDWLEVKKTKKCDFFKWEYHNLSHLILRKGTYAFPEKVQSIKDLPVPRIPKGVRQILDLTGYYHKFIPVYVDLIWPLTQLTPTNDTFQMDWSMS